ncbi:MAG TPA: tetratricopeptide repeat protein [Cytophagaceae bacterium]|nr:tetratricopeptide repeat protein [Cytophagaceae bacterium]
MKNLRWIALLGLIVSFSCARKNLTEQSSGAGVEKKEEKFLAFEHFYLEGMKFYILGNNADAQAYFDKALHVNPENAAVNYMLGKIALAKNEDTKAIAYAGKASKIDQKNKYYALLLAKSYEQKLNADEAVKVYKRILAEIPNTEEHYFDLANLFIYQRNYADALKIYNKIEDIYGQSAELTRQKQQIYLRENKLDKAIEEGEHLVKAFPDDNDIKAAHAEFLYTNKKEEEAIKLLEELVKSDPENPRSHLILADIYQMKGQKEKAKVELEIVFNNPEVELNTKLKIIEDFIRSPKTEDNKNTTLRLGELMTKAHPGDSRAYSAMGEIYLMNDRKNDAWKEFIISKNIDGGNYNLWLQLINLDSELQQTDSIIRHSEEALELFPNQATLWLYNGSGYSMKKDYKRAIDSFEEGKKLSGTNQEMRNYFNIHLGDTYHYTNDYLKSDAAYEEVLKFDQNNEHVLNNYSYFLSLRKEKLPEAKNMSEKLVRKYPTEATYLDTYAWVLYVMKDYEGAKKYLETAILNSNNGTIVEHYGDVLYQLGDKENAIEQWKKAKKLGETSEFIEKKIAEGKLYE